MIRAVIFDMGGTLLRYVRPGNGAWREFEERGIRGLYRYLVAQGHPMTAGEEAFVAHMFERLAQGWEQATGGHINLRAVDWIATGAGRSQPDADGERADRGSSPLCPPLTRWRLGYARRGSGAGGVARAWSSHRADLQHHLARRPAPRRPDGAGAVVIHRLRRFFGRPGHLEAPPPDFPPRPRTFRRQSDRSYLRRR
jgi:hypothetical protein